MDTFKNRRWLVIPTTLTGSIDFGQVLESGPEALRLSIDGTQTFVKYDINIIEEDYTVVVPNPETQEEDSYIVKAGLYGRPNIYSPEYPEYEHQPMLELLATPEWSQPLPIDPIK